MRVYLFRRYYKYGKKMKIKKGDEVLVIAGKDKGKKVVLLALIPRTQE